MFKNKPTRGIEQAKKEVGHSYCIADAYEAHRKRIVIDTENTSIRHSK